MRYEDGLAVWDALRSTGVMAFGVETYANSRRMEKSLRLQNADLLTEYNLLEADLRARRSRKRISAARRNIWNTARGRHQPAMLCTLALTDNTDSQGRGALSGRHHAGPRSRRPARRWWTRSAAARSRRRWPTARRSARTSRWPICRTNKAGEGQRCSRSSISARRYPVEGRGRRLQAALRSGEPQAAELMPVDGAALEAAEL